MIVEIARKDRNYLSEVFRMDISIINQKPYLIAWTTPQKSIEKL
jgi:hypothetical protein